MELTIADVNDFINHVDEEVLDQIVIAAVRANKVALEIMDEIAHIALKSIVVSWQANFDDGYEGDKEMERKMLPHLNSVIDYLEQRKEER